MTDTRATVLRLVKANPRISAAEIAREAGVSRARVWQLLEESGYQLQWRKIRKTRK